MAQRAIRPINRNIRAQRNRLQTQKKKKQRVNQSLNFSVAEKGEEEEEEEENLGVSVDGGTETVFFEVSVAVNSELFRLFRRRSVWTHYAEISCSRKFYRTRMGT